MESAYIHNFKMTHRFIKKKKQQRDERVRNKPAQLLHSLGNAYLRAFLFFGYS